MHKERKESFLIKKIIILIVALLELELMKANRQFFEAEIHLITIISYVNYNLSISFCFCLDKV